LLQHVLELTVVRGKLVALQVYSDQKDIESVLVGRRSMTCF
jgi:hypothetical protein